MHHGHQSQNRWCLMHIIPLDSHVGRYMTTYNRCAHPLFDPNTDGLQGNAYFFFLHKLTISAVDSGSQTVPTSVGCSTDFRYLTTETKKEVNNRPRLEINMNTNRMDRVWTRVLQNAVNFWTVRENSNCSRILPSPQRWLILRQKLFNSSRYKINITRIKHEL